MRFVIRPYNVVSTSTSVCTQFEPVRLNSSERSENEFDVKYGIASSPFKKVLLAAMKIRVYCRKNQNRMTG